MARISVLSPNFSYRCFTWLTWLLVLLQRVVIYLFNVSMKRDKKQRKPLHVYQICMGYRTSINPNYCHFLQVFQKFECLDFLRNDNVSIFSVDLEFAYFVEVSKGVDIYNGDKTLNFTDTQFLQAIRIIHVPIRDFLEFADSLPVDHAKFIYISNHCPYGFIMDKQIFNREFVVTIEQPGVLINTGAQPSLLTSQMVSAVLKTLVKPTSHRPKVYIVKNWQFGVHLVPLINRNFPQVNMFFLYRDGRSSVDAVLKATYNNPEIHLPKSMSKLLPYYPTRAPRYGVFRDHLIQCFASFVTWQWCSTILFYHGYREQDIDLVGMNFQDYVDQPEELLLQLLLKSKLSPESAKKCLSSANIQSQRRDTSVRAKVLPEYDNTEVKTRCDALCDVLKVPRLRDTIVLPGTLLHDDSNDIS